MKSIVAAIILALTIVSPLPAQTISSLNPVTTPLTGAEIAPVVQSNSTKRVTLNQMGSFFQTNFPAPITPLSAGLQGTVRMVPNVGGTGWTAYKPDGTALSTAGETSCASLQDAINYAVANAYPLLVTGYAQEAITQQAISCNTSITFPPMAQQDIRFASVNITFGAGIGANDGLVFDSTENTFFEMSGQVVYLGTGNAVKFKPVNATVVDVLKIVSESKFVFDAVVGAPGTNAGIVIDNTNGSFSRNSLRVTELNGGGATYGLLVTNPTASTGTFQNSFEIDYLHSFLTAGVQVATSTTNATVNRENTWLLKAMTSSTTNNDGMVTYGNGDFIRLGILDGGTRNALTFNSGATNNTFILNAINLAGSALVDNAGGTTGNGGFVNGIATASSYTVTGSNVPANGLYLAAANTPAFASNTTAAGGISSAQLWTVGSGVTAALNGETGALTAVGTGASGHIDITRFNGAGGGGAAFIGRVSAGATYGTHGAISSGNILAQLQGIGDDGTNYNTTAGNVQIVADGAPSAGIIPGRIMLITADSAGAGKEGLRVTSTQQVNLSSGYAQYATVLGSAASGTTFSTSAGNVSYGSAGGTTTLGDASLTITAASPVLTNLATDATHTDRTVCQDSTSKSLYFGSGAVGVCLGTSAARFKRDIQPMTAGTAELMNLKPVNYFYREGYGDDGASRQYGLVADDVAHAIPDIVRYDDTGRVVNYDWGSLIFVMVHTIQEQQAEIEAIKKKLHGAK